MCGVRIHFVQVPSVFSSFSDTHSRPVLLRAAGVFLSRSLSPGWGVGGGGGTWFLCFAPSFEARCFLG